MIAIAKDNGTREVGLAPAELEARQAILARVLEALEREREALDDIHAQLFAWVYEGAPPLPMALARVGDGLLAKHKV